MSPLLSCGGLLPGYCLGIPSRVGRLCLPASGRDSQWPARGALLISRADHGRRGSRGCQREGTAEVPAAGRGDKAALLACYGFLKRQLKIHLRTYFSSNGVRPEWGAITTHTSVRKCTLLYTHFILLFITKEGVFEVHRVPLRLIWLKYLFFKIKIWDKIGFFTIIR